MAGRRELPRPAREYPLSRFVTSSSVEASSGNPLERLQAGAATSWETLTGRIRSSLHVTRQPYSRRQGQCPQHQFALSSRAPRFHVLEHREARTRLPLRSMSSEVYLLLIS